MKTTLTTIVVLGVAAGCGIANAQPPGGPGAPGGFIRMMPITAALDTNGDGEISMAEIDRSVSVLKKLDKDGNGKLTEDEVRPAFDGRRGRGEFGNGRRGPDGSRGGPGGPGGGEALNPEEIVARYLSMDKNKDDKLTKEEVGERLQRFLARADADNDGVATRLELTQLVSREASFGRGQGGPGGGPPEFGRRGPNPEEFVKRAMMFDADKDGQLDKGELGKMAEQFGRGGPGGGRGERGRGGFGGPERGETRRSQRPARPE
jgi:Ca2+-binding EF-hand superfamily protein